MNNDPYLIFEDLVKLNCIFIFIDRTLEQRAFQSLKKLQFGPSIEKYIYIN